MTIIIYLFLIFLAVIGLCDLIHTIRILFLRPHKNNGKVLLCFLNNNFAELQLAFIIEQYKWHGNKYCDKIVAVDCQHNDDVSNRCYALSQRHEIEFLKREDLCNYICSEIKF